MLQKDTDVCPQICINSSIMSFSNIDHKDPESKWLGKWPVSSGKTLFEVKYNTPYVFFLSFYNSSLF